jgi:hypothetical protein
MQSPAGKLIMGGAAVVALEAFALLALSVAALVTISSDRVVLGATNAAFFGAYGLGLGACARGLSRLRTWCRSPIVLAQLIQLGIAWSFAGRSTAWLTVALAVTALLVLVAMLAPSTTNALYGSKQTDGE